MSSSCDGTGSTNFKLTRLISRTTTSTTTPSQSATKVREFIPQAAQSIQNNCLTMRTGGFNLADNHVDPGEAAQVAEADEPIHQQSSSSSKKFASQRVYSSDLHSSRKSACLAMASNGQGSNSFITLSTGHSQLLPDLTWTKAKNASFAAQLNKKQTMESPRAAATIDVHSDCSICHPRCDRSSTDLCSGPEP